MCLHGSGSSGFKEIDVDEMAVQYRYPKGGPVGGTTITDIKDNYLTFSPTTPGHALIYDTGTLTARADYRISREQFSRISPEGYDIRSGILGYAVPGKGALGAWTGAVGLSLTCGAFHDLNPCDGGNSRIDEWQVTHPYFFVAENQTAGDGVSNLSPRRAHNVTMAIDDTGSDETSTFRYTFKQQDNVWTFEVTFARLREVAEHDAPGQGGKFVDGLIAAARSGTKRTGSAYYVYSCSAKVKFVCNTVECKWERAGK